MENVIQMSGVCKRYQHFQIENLQLALPAGEIMGLVGVNGAGKSTTIRILMGLIEADAGEVNVLGYSLPRDQVKAKTDIGFASEDMRLYKNKDLNWHMRFIRAIFPKWDAEYASLLLKKFGLQADQPTKGFSHGQRVKAGLLLLLARRPDLLIMDEPTTGLDPVARCDVMEELGEILRDEHRSVLFSSHNTHDVEQLSDTLTFMHEGKILASEGIDDFLDGWRYVQCRGDSDVASIDLPNIASSRRSGRMLNIKLDKFDDSCLAFLKSRGLEVIEVRRMSLEEIFIATVKKEVNHEA